LILQEVFLEIKIKYPILSAMYHFPVSGVETYWWFPGLVSLVASFFSSTGGLSGAFILLPFQVSILGYVAPGVSATNLLFNVIAIPGGVYRYWREKRMVWALAWAITLGTIPGIFLGAYFRVKFLPDPAAFKLFAGSVLLYIGVRLARDIFKVKIKKADSQRKDFKVKNPRFSFKSVKYEFEGESFRVPTIPLMLLCFLVGIVGGTYGIGGGAIIVPILVAVYRLPVYTVAGAGLFGTFAASIAGTIIYAVISTFQVGQAVSTAPDLKLGFLLGIGGFIGIYFGARAQKFMPEKVIKIILTVLLLFVAVRYIGGFFF